MRLHRGIGEKSSRFHVCAPWRRSRSRIADCRMRCSLSSKYLFLRNGMVVGEGGRMRNTKRNSACGCALEEPSLPDNGGDESHAAATSCPCFMLVGFYLCSGCPVLTVRGASQPMAPPFPAT